MINVYNGLKYKKIIERVFDNTLDFFNLSEMEVDLTFVSDKAIKEINNRTRNIDEITDVLSFPSYDDFLSEYQKSDKFKGDLFNPDSDKIYLGEILISKTVMKKQAADMAITEDIRCAELTVHSLLHLLGFDHYTKEEKIAMWDTEEKILKSSNCGRNDREKYE